MPNIEGLMDSNILKSSILIKIRKKRCGGLYHGTALLSFLGPKIWNLVPLEIKQLESLAVFKLKIKKCIPFECPSRLCRTYIQQVGFV